MTDLTDDLAAQPDTPDGDAPGAGSSGGEIIIRSLSKGLRVLALFSIDRPEWTVKRIMHETGLPRPTVYRVMRTLEEERFVVFDAHHATYHLGPAMLPAVYLIQDEAQLLKVLHADLVALSRESGELASLGVDANNAVVTMDVVGGPDLAHVWVPRSRVQVGLANSHAKILTAYKSREEQHTILARPVVQRTPHTIMDPRAIAAELAEVARTGVAFDCEEEVVGICGVGAPIRDRTGAVIASVAIVAPAKRFGLERRGALADLVRRGAAAMSSRLGYQSPP